MDYTPLNQLMTFSAQRRTVHSVLKMRMVMLSLEAFYNIVVGEKVALMSATRQYCLAFTNEDTQSCFAWYPKASLVDLRARFILGKKQHFGWLTKLQGPVTDTEWYLRSGIVKEYINCGALPWWTHLQPVLGVPSIKISAVLIKTICL